MNRVIAGIGRIKKEIDDKIAKNLITADQVEKTRVALDLKWDEYTTFHALNGIALTTGKLSLEESKTIYHYLGEGGPNNFNGQPVEVKATLTQILRELMAAKRS